VRWAWPISLRARFLFAAKDPLRVIPALMLGSAVAGALSRVFDSGFIVFFASSPYAVCASSYD